ncbi:MAG: type I glyceraldehyde-3-phosphate dehydrogenase [Candidatus Babeliales bacterium]
MRVVINGFGRIGRNFLRTVLQDEQANKKLKVVAINVGPAKVDCIGHMFKYDTLMGTYPGVVSMNGDEMIVDDHRIKIVSELDPQCLPWKQLNIDWVVECTGKFTCRDGAEEHLAAGAKYVLISAPAEGEDIAIVPGVNEKDFDKNKDHIVSLGSCTTNAFIPMLKVLHDSFGIEKGFMTTIHAYTNSQVLLDVNDTDLRRARAAALNIIPTNTGAATMLCKVLPELDGRLSAMAVRVPLGKVSLIDLVFVAKRPLTVEAIHDVFTKAAQKTMNGIVDLTMEPLVSSDFDGNAHSVVIDGLLTQVNGQMGKLFGWYDNEWAYSTRLKDFLLYVE